MRIKRLFRAHLGPLGAQKRLIISLCLAFLVTPKGMANNFCVDIFKAQVKQTLDFDTRLTDNTSLIFDTHFANVLVLKKLLEASKTDPRVAQLEQKLETKGGLEKMLKLFMNENGKMREAYESGLLTHFEMSYLWSLKFSEQGRTTEAVHFIRNFYKAKGLLPEERPLLLTSHILQELFPQSKVLKHRLNLFDWSPNSLGLFLEAPNVKAKATREIELVEQRTADRDYYFRLLEKVDLGGNKGYMDKQIIVDVLLSQREQGTTPTFVTADKNILRGLLRIKIGEREQAESLIKELSNNKAATSLPKDFENLGPSTERSTMPANIYSIRNITVGEGSMARTMNLVFVSYN